MDNIEIVEMKIEEIGKVASIHEQCFARQGYSSEWVAANFGAYPKTHYFVAKHESKFIGFIQWAEKSGFREEAVFELEQIAVLPECRGQSVGTQLITQSLKKVKSFLGKRGAVLKRCIVTTRADNSAQMLYRKVLGAEVEATIKGLYSADEVIMVARSV